MLWIALFVPQLPLQLAQRALHGSHAVAIVDGPVNRPLVHCANPEAHEYGVRPGMSALAARALAGDLITKSRDPSAEARALDNLAGWAYQFTPCVVILHERGLLLEVESALQLHGGLASLLARIRQGAIELGYTLSLGVAPTPLAAWLFSKARHAGHPARTCIDSSVLAQRLHDLPLHHFEWPPETLEKLAALGIARIGECMALPRDGFRQRFGSAPALDLDRAHGLAPDPRPYFRPPEQFSSRIEFGFEVSDAIALLFPLRRLLKELEGFLRARGRGVQEWHLHLECSGRVKTRATLGTVRPECEAELLLGLAREKLCRTPLAAPALSIAVEANQFFPIGHRNGSLLPDPREHRVECNHLVDKLTARLGAEKIYSLRSVDDHRPERGWRSVGATDPRNPLIPLANAPRPLWLLRSPRTLLTEGESPLCQGRLQLIAGPERIETGWWDGQPAGRDYYVARNTHGETFWVFREHRQLTWYLHGIFA